MPRAALAVCAPFPSSARSPFPHGYAEQLAALAALAVASVVACGVVSASQTCRTGATAAEVEAAAGVGAGACRPGSGSMTTSTSSSSTTSSRAGGSRTGARRVEAGTGAGTTGGHSPRTPGDRLRAVRGGPAPAAPV